MAWTKTKEEEKMEYEKGSYRVVVDEESGDWLIYFGRELFGCLNEDDREAVLDSTEQPFGLSEWVENEALAHAEPVYELLLEVAGDQGR